MSGFSSSSQPTSFLAGTYTIATLPDPAANAKIYAWVTDLHDNQPDRVISDGTYWKPVRPLATRAMSNANQAMTFAALVNSPTQILQGTLTANRNATLLTTYAYPGARFRFKREASGLFSIIVNALTTFNIAAGSWADVEYDASAGWVQTASGGLL